MNIREAQPETPPKTVLDVRQAQREVRTVFVGGSVGQAVSGLIWLISAALGQWVSTQAAILMLAVGGAAIFPLTQLALRLLGRPASLRRENPLNGLAMQVAFIVPLCLPVIAGSTLYRLNWFYPAFMVVVGAHYLPFVFLYGMFHYAVLGSALLVSGVAIGMYLNSSFTLGGWVGAALLLGFAAVVWRTWKE